MLTQKKCNRDISVNIYKLNFLTSHFSSQPNKKVFHHSTFILPTKHKWEKLKYFLYFFPTKKDKPSILVPSLPLSLSLSLSLFFLYKFKGIQIFSYKIMYTLSFLCVLVDVSSIMHDQL